MKLKLKKPRIILNPKNVWEKWLIQWSNIKGEFNGPVSIKVSPLMELDDNSLSFNPKYRYLPQIKWYRFSLVVTRRFEEDIKGEGAINCNLPRRFKRGWRNWDTDCWIWYVIPFHIIVPFFKKLKIWFFWEFVYNTEEWRKRVDPSSEVRRKIRTQAYRDGFNDARHYLKLPLGKPPYWLGLDEEDIPDNNT